LESIRHNQNYIIGSAQIGQDYGIAGSKPLNLKNNAIKFIQQAIKNNFLSFDTAASYGNSEKYIGASIKDINKKIKIFTKIPKLKDQNIDIAEKYFNKSLKKLNINYIEGLFLHHPMDWKITGMRNFVNQLKNKNLINKFGLSIYDEFDIPNDKDIDLIQVPGNIFNQKLIKSSKLENFHKEGGTVLIRSIFIQGLLFFEKNNFPKNLKTLEEPILKLHKLAYNNNLTIESLAIKTVEKICPYGKLVIGCNNIKQLEVLSKTSKIKINNDIITEAINIGNKYYSNLWDPRNWK